jgi:dipeptidyl aminopeptidase/acylaminoacyl peptidase
MDIEIMSIDISELYIPNEDIMNVKFYQNSSKMIVVYGHYGRYGGIALFERDVSGHWSLAFSEEFSDLENIEVSPSGKMLALVYRDEQRIALFDMDQKTIIAETEVFYPKAFVSWSEDERKLISFVKYGYFHSSAEVAEVFSVPSLERIKMIVRSNSENEIWSAWFFWWSPDNENDKFIIKSDGDLLYWEGENYEVLDPIDVVGPNTQIRVSWINENEYLVLQPLSYFYLFNGSNLVDEFNINQYEDPYQRVVEVKVNPETLRIGALLTDCRLVLLEIRDNEIESLCQININSIPAIGAVKLIGLFSDNSLYYLSTDNIIHIVSNISCE